jgi:hypothetical protein
MKTFFLFILLATCAVNFAAAPDHRPKFDKSSYQGTVWSQVNP